MKKQVTLKLNRKLYQDLTKIKCDKAKAKAIETIGAMVYKQVYPNISRIDMNNDRLKQITEGDFLVVWEKGHDKVEVKKGTIHDFLKKLVLDILYLNSDLTDRYKQSTTNSEKGWLYTCNSDILMCYIEDTKEFYVIHNFQTVKENLIKTVEMDDRKYNLMNSYGKELRNNCYKKANVELETKEKPYNYYIQADTNKNDEIVKQTLCLSLHLDKYFVGFARCNLDIIELDIEIIN